MVKIKKSLNKKVNIFRNNVKDQLLIKNFIELLAKISS